MKIEQLPLIFKKAIMVFADLIWIPGAIWLATIIRYGHFDFTMTMRDLAVYGVTVVCSMIIFLNLGLYRAVIRYMGEEAITAVIRGVTISAVFLGAMIVFSRAEIPRSVPFIYWGIAMFFVGGSRFAIWFYYQSPSNKNSKKIIIYGAGDAGMQLLKSIKRSAGYCVVALLDDDRNIKGRTINGVKVYRPHHLHELVQKHNIEQVLIALPSVSARRKKEIISQLEDESVLVKTIPSLDNIVNGKVNVEELREIEIEDLLGRDSITPDEALFEQCIEDQVVLVTGAGGSIGSELCRQIIKHSPKQIILFEISEFALYSLEQELLKVIPADIKLTALLGSVQDKKRMQGIFTVYGVNTVYHAAAYKHVPIVEENIIEGIRNNIFGTRYAAEAAQSAGVSTFVLISTDKAVRPTNVMGTTKRFSEMVLQALSEKNRKFEKEPVTRFCMVRFGNVLGSSGSVVPLFKKQIKNGGPVTVTHPDIIRYFMTIPEAVQLVLQAGSLGKGGDVFVLDMGEPVKIADLAKKMIRLSGFEVKDDISEEDGIEISYSGLRHGEKLYEELLIGDNVTGTQHPRIMRAEEKMLPLSVIDEKMALLDEACNDFNVARIREILLESETGYLPDKDQPVDLLWCELKKKESNVVSLKS